jgi:microcystin-dependent protein
MSIYKKPIFSNIFNPINFDTSEKDNECDENLHDDSVHLEFVNKSGDSMSGILNLPQLKFQDNTSQTSAFTNNIKNDVINNTSKLVNINSINDIVEINKIKTNEIILTDLNGNQNFGASDKIQILSNQGNIQILSNNVQINYNNIQINADKILILENSTDEHIDHIEQNILTNKINVTNINTIVKNVHNNSIHINKNSININNLLNMKNDVINNTNEIQKTKTDLIIINDEINNNTIKTLENEQKINVNTENIINMSVPVGTILTTAISPSQAPPLGYLYCDGALVQISTYPALYSILLSTYAYNKPNHSGNFYLPDLRQLFIRGSQQNTTYPVNAQPVAMGTYQGQSIQQHSHNYSKSLSETSGSGLVNFSVGSNTHVQTKTSDMFDNNNQIFQNNSETRPESISLNYMIKF